MTKIMDKVVNDIQELSQTEKNDLLKYLIYSMDDTHDIDSEKHWADISKKRFDEIKSSKVETVNWEDIKQKVLL